MENWLIFQYLLKFRWGDAVLKVRRGSRNIPFKCVAIGAVGKSAALGKARKYTLASAEGMDLKAAEKNL
jgi:hypothetical protein